MRKCLLLLFALVSLEAFCGGEVSIMTYNIKMLPRGAAFIHHHPVIRARKIPAKLMEEGADVIVFQEAFDGKADRILRRKLKPMYPYCAGWKNRKVVTYKRAGGVLMFSKYPMRELESIKYSQCKGIDCIGAKGALMVEVDHPVQKFQLLGTHMQAGGGRDLKMSQYGEAGALLKRHAKDGIPQFASGDFNTHRNDNFLYPNLLDSLDAKDGPISGEQQYTSDHRLNDMDTYDPDRRNLIDFVFYRTNGVTFGNGVRVIKRFQEQWNKKHKDLSDHFAVVLRQQF